MKNDQSLVSIILVNYNGEDFIEECLDSLRQIDYPKENYEVILVDNASKDNSVKLVKENFPEVKLIKSDKNLGFPGGCNLGVDVAKGEYLVFLNTDATVDKFWLNELVDTISSDERIGACSSQVLYASNKTIINTVGGFWSVLGIPGSLGEGKIRDSYKNGTLISSPTGASMIIKSDVYRAIGGFDNDYFLYCDDADIGWRLWNRKMKVVFVSSSIVYHRVTASLKGLGKKTFSEWYYFYSARNRLITILKNARAIDLLWMLPLYFTSHLGLSLLFGIRGKFTAMKATLKGMIYPFSNNWWREKRKHSNKTGYANAMMIGLIDTMRMFLSKKKKHFV